MFFGDAHMLGPMFVALVLGAAIGWFSVRKAAAPRKSQTPASTSAPRWQDGAVFAEMSSGLAHEINNPLVVLGGLSSKLAMLSEKGPVSVTDAQDIARRISTITDRISRTVKSFHAITRDESAEPVRMVSVGDALDRALMFFRERFHNHAVRLEVVKPALPIELEGRTSELTQLLLQPLAQAFEMVQTPDNVGDWWIQVTLAEVAEQVEIRVATSTALQPPFVISLPKRSPVRIS